MAQNVVVQVLGGKKEVMDGMDTIGQIKTKLNLSAYTATINGDSASDSDDVQDGDFVALSQGVKGGLI